MFKRINKISVKFIIVLVPIVTLCTLLFIGVFVYLKYDQLRQELDAKMQLIASMNALAIAEPLWMLNYESMYRNINTITTHPEILCVEVVDIYKEKTHGLSQHDCHNYQVNQHLLHSDLVFNNEKVGELILYYTEDSIIDSMLREVEIGGLLFFLLVITTIFTALIALRIIIGVPLRHLLQSIRSADDVRATVAWSSQDELGEVITSYNDMIRQVAQRERDLNTARQQAEEASRAKSAFLANMSHELRNPLNAIIGFSRIVMRRSKQELAPKQYDNIKKILTSAEHLLSLINNILDLSKIEAGRMEIRYESCDLELIIDTCLHSIEPMLRSKGLQLVTQVEPDLPVIYSDQEKIKQIMLNLLSNAVKFTKQGTISVRANMENGQALIAVTDTGIGISENQLLNIFDEFTQIDSGSTKEYGGTGLGLAICQHLVELLGGTISVKSQLNQGSTFTVTLPVQHSVATNNTSETGTSEKTMSYEENFNR